jgi:hypothetical protein
LEASRWDLATSQGAKPAHGWALEGLSNGGMGAKDPSAAIGLFKMALTIHVPVHP